MTEERIENLKKELDAAISKYGEFHEETAICYYNLAKLYYDNKEYSLCYDCMLKLQEVVRHFYTPMKPKFEDGDSDWILRPIIKPNVKLRMRVRKFYQAFWAVSKILYGKMDYRTLQIRVELIKVESYKKALADLEKLKGQVKELYGEESIEYKEMSFVKSDVEEIERDRINYRRWMIYPFDPEGFDARDEKKIN